MPQEFTVLMAHPLVLRNLVTEYETLRALHAERAPAQVRRRLEDVTYTLCVSTGTRDADTALAAARQHLEPSDVLAGTERPEAA